MLSCWNAAIDFVYGEHYISVISVKAHTLGIPGRILEYDNN